MSGVVSKWKQSGGRASSVLELCQLSVTVTGPFTVVSVCQQATMTRKERKHHQNIAGSLIGWPTMGVVQVVSTALLTSPLAKT